MLAFKLRAKLSQELLRKFDIKAIIQQYKSKFSSDTTIERLKCSDKMAETLVRRPQ